MLQNRYPRVSLKPPFRSNNDTASSSEDEGDRFLREDEERERELSSRHGEASENSTGIKKQQTDAEIASALKTNDATKRKKRHVLTEITLTGSKGLIKIRRDFTSKVRYRSPNFNAGVAKRNGVSKRKRMELEVQAAATYTSNLMHSYEEFATDLMPTDHFIDTLNKIQDLGSKKQVKAYLGIMREEVCKQYITGIHGKEKTEKLFNELEHGLQTHKKRLLDEAANEMDVQLQDEKESSATTSLTNSGVENDSTKENNVNLSESGNKSGLLSDTSGKELVAVSELGVIGRAQSISAKGQGSTTYSSDEEEVEASFDDVTGSTVPKFTNNIESPNDGRNDVSGVDDEGSDGPKTHSSDEEEVEASFDDVTGSTVPKCTNNIESPNDGRNDDSGIEDEGSDGLKTHTAVFGHTDDAQDDERESQEILNTQLSTITHFSQADSESQERLTLDTSQGMVETQIESKKNSTSDGWREIDRGFDILEDKSYAAKECQISIIVESSQIESGKEESLVFDSSHSTTNANTTLSASYAKKKLSQDY